MAGQVEMAFFCPIVNNDREKLEVSRGDAGGKLSLREGAWRKPEYGRMRK